MFAPCLEALERLNIQEGWGLMAQELRALAQAIAPQLDRDSSPTQIRTVCVNYRSNVGLVRALGDSCSADHAELWAAWMTQARAILRHARCDWAADVAVDLDDLAQIAMLELCRALPSYRYQSRFSTWAYQVIVRGVQRHLRDMSAQKRVGDIVYGIDPRDLPVPAALADAPEAQALSRTLEHTVEEELERAIGERNTTVFRLWACEDLPAEAIGEHVGLSVARVYAIIAQARKHLQGNESVRHWHQAR